MYQFQQKYWLTARWRHVWNAQANCLLFDFFRLRLIKVLFHNRPCFSTLVDLVLMVLFCFFYQIKGWFWSVSSSAVWWSSSSASSSARSARVSVAVAAAIRRASITWWASRTYPRSCPWSTRRCQTRTSACAHAHTPRRHDTASLIKQLERPGRRFGCLASLFVSLLVVSAVVC